MMDLKEIMKQLEDFGNSSTKKTHMRHGAKEPLFGVKVADLKKILKKTKKNHALSLELYATGNSDAMYLAGLMADENKITKSQLQSWVEKAYWYFLSEYAVSWVAAETEYGFELGLEWIDAPEENIAAAGWSALAYHAGVRSDSDLDIAKYEALLDRISKEIHHAQNRVRYAMNGFVISIGSYIIPLTSKSKEVAQKIGKVDVEMNETACKVPLATTYIQKVEDKGRLGKKRKTARC